MSKADELSDDQKKILQRHGSLGSAIKNNDVEWAELYIDQTKDSRTGTITKAEWTKLMFGALDTITPETADFLLAQGADPHHVFDKNLQTHIEIVGIARMLIGGGSDELLKHLITTGVIDLDTRSVGGDTMLMLALAVENTELADWLLDAGVPLDGQNLAGFNALHQSALHVRFISTEWLLAHGIDPEVPTVEGSVAVQLIPTTDETGENDAMFDILEDYSEAFATGFPVVPEALAERATKLRFERQVPDEDAAPASSRPKPR